LNPGGDPYGIPTFTMELPTGDVKPDGTYTGPDKFVRNFVYGKDRALLSEGCKVGLCKCNQKGSEVVKVHFALVPIEVKCTVERHEWTRCNCPGLRIEATPCNCGQ
jgi:hypothetical protein